LIGITIDNVTAEVSSSNIITLGDQDSNLSTMINNALLGNTDSTPSDTPILSDGGEEYQVIHSLKNSHSQLSTMINNALLGNTDSTSSDTPILSDGGEEYQVIHSLKNSHSQLSTMINNALLGNTDSTSSDTSSIYYVQEQFITIEPDGYNDNIIFEEPKKKVDLLNSNFPFLLPVPFP
jgi:hypothetical protein